MPKGKPNYKGKPRRNFKDKRTDRDDSVMDKKVSCNDPSWYIREGQLAKDVASFSFNTALGNAVELYVDSPDTQNVSGKRVAVPGIMRLHTIPCLGYSGDGNSAINLAAKNLYSWVRHANSGHSNYDSPDLMLYIAAMDNLYAFIWHLQRAYGTARVYSQKNRYIGDALLRAMGFVPNEVRQNLANFRAYINMLIVKASAFCTPTTMSIFKRHTWMYSGVFKDEDVEKSQMYLYVPDYLYKYNENAGAGKLDPIPVIARSVLDAQGRIEPVNNFLNTWYTIGDTMINALVASEDINIMSGDIRKAFGDNIWQIGLVNEDFVTVPIYSEEILDQIHNTIFVGRRPLEDNAGALQSGIGSMTIYQDVLDPLEPIKCKPIFASSYEACVTHFLDMAENEPTPERVLVATRNMVHGINKIENNADVTYLDSFGSDICLYGDMYSFSSGGSEQVDFVYGDYAQYIDIEKFTKFNKAPLIYKFDYTGSAWAIEEIVGELGDFIVVDYKDINKMHESALLSMLGVPV